MSADHGGDGERPPEAVRVRAAELAVHRGAARITARIAAPAQRTLELPVLDFEVHGSRELEIYPDRSIQEHAARFRDGGVWIEGTFQTRARVLVPGIPAVCCRSGVAFEVEIRCVTGSTGAAVQLEGCRLSVYQPRAAQSSGFRPETSLEFRSDQPPRVLDFGELERSAGGGVQ